MNWKEFFLLLLLLEGITCEQHYYGRHETEYRSLQQQILRRLRIEGDLKGEVDMPLPSDTTVDLDTTIGGSSKRIDIELKSEIRVTDCNMYDLDSLDLESVEGHEDRYCIKMNGSYTLNPLFLKCIVEFDYSNKKDDMRNIRHEAWELYGYTSKEAEISFDMTLRLNAIIVSRMDFKAWPKFKFVLKYPKQMRMIGEQIVKQLPKDVVQTMNVWLLNFLKDQFEFSSPPSQKECKCYSDPEIRSRKRVNLPERKSSQEMLDERIATPETPIILVVETTDDPTTIVPTSTTASTSTSTKIVDRETTTSRTESASEVKSQLFDIKSAAMSVNFTPDPVDPSARDVYTSKPDARNQDIMDHVIMSAMEPLTMQLGESESRSDPGQPQVQHQPMHTPMHRPGNNIFSQVPSTTSAPGPKIVIVTSGSFDADFPPMPTMAPLVFEDKAEKKEYKFSGTPKREPVALQVMTTTPTPSPPTLLEYLKNAPKPGKLGSSKSPAAMTVPMKKHAAANPADPMSTVERGVGTNAPTEVILDKTLNDDLAEADFDSASYPHYPQFEVPVTEIIYSWNDTSTQIITVIPTRSPAYLKEMTDALGHPIESGPQPHYVNPVTEIIQTETGTKIITRIPHDDEKPMPEAVLPYSNMEKRHHKKQHSPVRGRDGSWVTEEEEEVPHQTFTVSALSIAQAVRGEEEDRESDAQPHTLTKVDASEVARAANKFDTIRKIEHDAVQPPIEHDDEGHGEEGHEEEGHEHEGHELEDHAEIMDKVTTTAKFAPHEDDEEQVTTEGMMHHILSMVKAYIINPIKEATSKHDDGNTAESPAHTFTKHPEGHRREPAAGIPDMSRLELLAEADPSEQGSKSEYPTLELTEREIPGGPAAAPLHQKLETVTPRIDGDPLIPMVVPRDFVTEVIQTKESSTHVFHIPVGLDSPDVATVMIPMSQLMSLQNKPILPASMIQPVADVDQVGATYSRQGIPDESSTESGTVTQSSQEATGKPKKQVMSVVMPLDQDDRGNSLPPYVSVIHDRDADVAHESIIMPGILSHESMIELGVTPAPMTGKGEAPKSAARSPALTEDKLPTPQLAQYVTQSSVTTESFFNILKKLEIAISAPSEAKEAAWSNIVPQPDRAPTRLMPGPLTTTQSPGEQVASMLKRMKDEGTLYKSGMDSSSPGVAQLFQGGGKTAVEAEDVQVAPTPLKTKEIKVLNDGTSATIHVIPLSIKDPGSETGTIIPMLAAIVETNKTQSDDTSEQKSIQAFIISGDQTGKAGRGKFAGLDGETVTMISARAGRVNDNLSEMGTTPSLTDEIDAPDASLIPPSRPEGVLDSQCLQSGTRCPADRIGRPGRDHSGTDQRRARRHDPC